MWKISERINNDYNTCRVIRNRELGMRNRVGYADNICKKIYANLDAEKNDNPLKKTTTGKGGIFNLEYSLDGKLLAAACENKSILIYDSHNHKLIDQIDAHNGPVNNIKFLCTNSFTSCSDDSTVKIWDRRNLTKCVSTMSGHASCVKNMEYSNSDKVLVTSAFDGTIYGWDLTTLVEKETAYIKIFTMSGLVRVKLTPDATKMIIATTSGYIMIVHDLCLMTLYNDMKTFIPSVYRMVQNTNQAFPAATMYNYLFDQSRKTNRVEFIDDFPNNAEVITSVQIDPSGRAAMCRNVGANESNEWTTIHDIRTRDPKEYEDAFTIIKERFPIEDEDDEAARNEIRMSDLWMGYITNGQSLVGNNPLLNTYHTGQHSFVGIMNSGLISRNPCRRFEFDDPSNKYKIMRNIKRLTYYAEEESSDRGFIKEPAFSMDGRIICSPYETGLRLFGFNGEMQEMQYCNTGEPKELYTLSILNEYHTGIVVCSKFNPVHYEMATGCLAGEIVWYKPVL